MRYLTILFLLGLLLSMPLQASANSGLYEAEVEVSDQDSSTRVAGMQKAMGTVLVKVSGSRSATDNKDIAQAMKDPSRYVQQYRYRNDASDGSNKGRLIMQVSFDPKSIDTLLRTQGFDIWGNTRPSTLVWLGVEDKGLRVIVGANDGGLLHEILTKEAERRALPLKLPQLDMTDRSRVTTSDIWGEFFDTLRKASERYEAQAILVGRLYPLTSNRWEVRWALDYQDKVERWQEQDSDVTSLIVRAVDRVADNLSQNSAGSVASGSGDLLIRIDEVNSLGEYRRVLEYLKGLTGVKQVVTESMSPDNVLLRLSTVGGRQTVLRAIALGNTLERVTQTEMQYPYSRPGSGMPMRPSQELPPGAASQPLTQTSEEGRMSNGNSGGLPVGDTPLRPDMVYRLLP